MLFSIRKCHVFKSDWINSLILEKKRIPITAFIRYVANITSFIDDNVFYFWPQCHAMVISVYWNHVTKADPVLSRWRTVAKWFLVDINQTTCLHKCKKSTCINYMITLLISVRILNLRIRPPTLRCLNEHMYKC